MNYRKYRHDVEAMVCGGMCLGMLLGGFGSPWVIAALAFACGFSLPIGPLSRAIGYPEEKKNV